MAEECVKWGPEAGLRPLGLSFLPFRFNVRAARPPLSFCPLSPNHCFAPFGPLWVVGWRERGQVKDSGKNIAKRKKTILTTPHETTQQDVAVTRA